MFFKIICYPDCPQHYLTSSSSQWLIQPEAKSPCLELLFCARLLESKGIIYFSNLASRYPQYKLSVYGGIDSSSKDSLSQAQIDELSSIHPNITFYGKVDTPLITNTASFPVLLVPSVYGEGFPRSVAEAMVLGVPVILSKFSALDIFTDQHCFISDHDVDSYSAQIENLLFSYSSGSLSAKLNLAKSYVLEHFSEQAIVDETLEIYSSLLSSPREPYIHRKSSTESLNWLSN